MIALVCLEPPRPGRAAVAAEALARRLGDVQIIAVSVGGSSTSEALTWARSRPCFQRILHLDDAAFDKADFTSVGMLLAEVAQHVKADLVIVGERSDLEGQGLVPAALAQQLRAPLFARVQDVHTIPDGLEVTVAAGGRLCSLACPCPVVLSVQAGVQRGGSADQAVVDKPAEPPSPAIEVEPIGLAQLGLDPSRLVPRPELLGSQVPVPAEKSLTLTPDQAARFLLRRP